LQFIAGKVQTLDDTCGEFAKVTDLTGKSQGGSWNHLKPEILNLILCWEWEPTGCLQNRELKCRFG
jgi:hypothetical protein